jgi:hypothetical protein
MIKEEFLKMIQEKVPDGADIRLPMPDVWEGHTTLCEPTVEKEDVCKTYYIITEMSYDD